ncbi:MAG: hypothetical protein GPJ54_12350 [Candidatus Heimdallarchaeota archaeon]|nr:hypothetical protein [Candidatus Heimdallarchaeota archaeon]
MRGLYYTKIDESELGKREVVDIEMDYNYIYLKDAITKEEIEFTDLENHEINYFIVKTDDINIKFQLVIYEENKSNFIDITLNKYYEEIISKYFDIPRISKSLDTIHIARIYLIKFMSPFLLLPIIASIIRLIFFTRVTYTEDINFLIIFLTLPLLIPPYILLDRYQKRMYLLKEQIAIEKLTEYNLDCKFDDRREKITWIDLYASVLGYDPDELKEALIMEGFSTLIDEENKFLSLFG